MDPSDRLAVKDRDLLGFIAVTAIPMWRQEEPSRRRCRLSVDLYIPPNGAQRRDPLFRRHPLNQGR